MLRFPGRSPFFVLVSLLFLASWLLPASSRDKSPPLPFLPEPTAPGAPPLDGEAWSLSTPAATARLERIDDATRLAYIVAATGFTIDPFATSPDRSGAFVNFRFDLENRSGGLIVFQSQACRLVVRPQKVERPIDLPTLEATYELFDREMPPAYANVRKALFDGQLLLRPGERASGLLIFHAVDDREKAYRVEVDWTTSEGRREGFEAPYRRPKKK